jgi:hypothetical protein
MRREPHVRFCERAAVKFHRATHLIVGFQHEEDARRFLDTMRERWCGKTARRVLLCGRTPLYAAPD